MCSLDNFICVRGAACKSKDVYNKSLKVDKDFLLKEDRKGM